MPTLSEVKAALVATIQANISTEVYVYNDIADVVELPAIMVMPLSMQYMVSAGQSSAPELYIYVLCPRSDTEAGQDMLDGFIANSGPDSIPWAVNTHDELGIGVRATVYAMHGYGGSFVVAGVPHVGAILKCAVLLDP